MVEEQKLTETVNISRTPLSFALKTLGWNGIIMKTARNLSCLGVNYANADRQRGNSRLKLHFQCHK